MINNGMNQLIGEGAISTEEVAKKVFVILKNIISVYGKELKGLRFSESEVGEFVDRVNDYIKRLIVDTKVCINFSATLCNLVPTSLNIIESGVSSKSGLLIVRFLNLALLASVVL